jgi:predicted nucleic acid-binding protein
MSSLLSRLFIDTNIFLELEFQDSRWQECKQLLEKVESGEIKAATSDFIVYSSILEIESKEGSRAQAKIVTFLTVLSSLKGLSILRPAAIEMTDAARFMNRRKLDYDDSYVVSSMKSDDIKTLVSFDRHFDKQTEIQRLEPIHVLETMQSEKVK